MSFRLADLTAEGRTVAALVDELRRAGFTPDLVLFPSTTPTLHADVAAMAAFKKAFGARLVCFGPHASTVPLESMAQAPAVDAMLVGEPEDAAVAAGHSRFTGQPRRRPRVVWRGADGKVNPPQGARGICRLQGHAVSGVGPAAACQLSPPDGQ